MFVSTAGQVTQYYQPRKDSPLLFYRATKNKIVNYLCLLKIRKYLCTPSSCNAIPDRNNNGSPDLQTEMRLCYIVLHWARNEYLGDKLFEGLVVTNFNKGLLKRYSKCKKHVSEGRLLKKAQGAYHFPHD